MLPIDLEPPSFRMGRSSEPAAPAPGSGRRPLTQSLPEQIAMRLAERILSSDYPPGQRIMEQAIAAEFEVSRGPVREALRLLEKDGLVTILARRGALVTKLSTAEVREIFDIRAMLNGLRDRSIAEDPGRERVLPALEAEVDALARHAADPALGDDYVETVFRLNRLLNRATPNQRLSHILSSLEMQTVRYSRLGLGTAERRASSVQSWKGLVAAIRAGDGAEAERIARARVSDSRDAAIRAVEELAALDSPDPVRA